MTSPKQISPEQLARLLDQQSRALELYAAQWCRSPEDCVQEAFVSLAARIPPPENEVAWLYRVVRNLAINAARSNARRTTHERAFPPGSEANFSDPAVVAAHADEVQQLADHLDSLAPESREIVVLRIWSGLTWDQIAELTKMSSSNAQRKYVKAIEQLGSLMRKNV